MGKIIFHTIDSENIYGTMNTGTIRLTNITDNDKKVIKEWRVENNLDLEIDFDKLSRDEKNIIFNLHREQFGNDNGFDGNRMFMADQNHETGNHKTGSFFEITEDYVKKNSNGWTDIPEDILVIKKDVPKVAIGHPVADCPVVMMSDEKQGITAIGHCSADLIDSKLPNMIAKCLIDNYNSDIEDIKVFVGACAGKDWTYDSWPKWAQDIEFWKKAIVEENGVFKIDIRKALDIQFKEIGLTSEQITYDEADTITDDKHYSNNKGRENPDKIGRQFIGGFYDEEDTNKNIR